MSVPSSSPASSPDAAARPAPKPENLWLNLLCNVVLPGLIMTKLSAPERLGPVWALVAGVALPLGYGIYDLIARRKWNLFSGVGLASVGLTGWLGLTKAGTMAFAIKEATIPAIFAFAILATLKTRQPLVRAIMLNESVINVPRLEAALAERGTRGDFDRLLVSCTWLLAGSFMLSAVLNFALARILLTGEPGTPEFTEQLGRMNWWSWPVIMVPSMAIMIVALWKLLKGMRALTGLEFDAFMHPKPAKKE